MTDSAGKTYEAAVLSTHFQAEVASNLAQSYLLPQSFIIAEIPVQPRSAHCNHRKQTATRSRSQRNGRDSRSSAGQRERT